MRDRCAALECEAAGLELPCIAHRVGDPRARCRAQVGERAREHVAALGLPRFEQRLGPLHRAQDHVAVRPGALDREQDACPVLVQSPPQGVAVDVIRQIDHQLVDGEGSLHLLHIDAHDVAAALADDPRDPAQRAGAIWELHSQSGSVAHPVDGTERRFRACFESISAE